MKTKLILIGFLALVSFGHAQNFNTTGTSNNVYRSGNTGFGMSSAPNSYKVEVETSSLNDGISLKQTGTSSGALHMFNTSTGGKHWALFSTGSGSSQGSGHFSIYEYASGIDRFFINGTSGYVGVGTNAPTNKLTVIDYATSPTTFIGVSGNVTSTGGGVDESTNIGVEGTSSEGNENTGGYFEGFGSGVLNYGVKGYAYDAGQNTGGLFYAGTAINSYGIEAIGEDYAGYFVGNVLRTGTDNFTSDRKLKKDIEPLSGALDKIKLLKPSVYNFRTNEYPAMNLPKGRQMGLIAQDLEMIFPELVTDMESHSYKNEKGEDIIIPTFKSVQYVSLIPVLISSIQEQQEQIEKQEQANIDLKSLIAMQQQQINDLLSVSSKQTGIGQLNTQMNGFSMEQNIPNPFTNETVVKYTLLPQTASASVVVYDLSGKQIKSFSIDQKNTSITISSDKLAPGIYIYSIIADGNVMDSKRMVVTEK